MFVVTVLFRIHPGKMDDFLPRMVENARLSRSREDGCQQFDVCRSGDEVFLYEVYDSEDAFKQHLASDHFKSFDAATGELLADKQVHLFGEVLR